MKEVIQSSRPDYESPPVVETILGVQFERLPNFRNAHLGAFWRTFASDAWPTVADAPPLEPQFEHFHDSTRWARAAIGIKLTQDPASRIQITNADRNQMIQLQNGRLHVNWLGQGGTPYPRYESIEAAFQRTLEQFLVFAKKEVLGEFIPNQWEVTYLNHISKGTVWETPADWNFFRPLNPLPTVPGLIQAESFGGTWHFVIPGDRGRLHVEWHHGSSTEDQKKEVVVLNLNARGPLIRAESVDGVLNGLRLGRETIVRSFASLMSEDANRAWELNNGDG